MVKNSNVTLTRSLTTCVVGGGNSAHILIPLLSEAGHKINLLTRRPKDWADVVYADMMDGFTGQVSQTHAGNIQTKSSDPADVIPDADIIILCLPVHQYRPALDKIAPYLHTEKEIFIGTVYGQGGFNWMVSSIERELGLENIVKFAIGSIPWICRTLEYGHRAANYGTKEVNLAAVTPRTKFAKLNDILLDDLSYRRLHRGKFRQACSFISLTMSVDNQIIHPARCFGLFQSSGGKWPKDKVPYFYRDFDEASADDIRKIDEDYTAVRTAIKKHFPDRDFQYMLNYLDLENLNHSSGQASILSSFKDSAQLASIKTPVVEQEDGTCKLNMDCRFFTDDIPYGLLIAKWIAEALDVETPFIDEVIQWAQKLRGEEFLTADNKINKDFCLEGKYTSGIPESYGFSSVEDILD